MILTIALPDEHKADPEQTWARITRLRSGVSLVTNLEPADTLMPINGPYRGEIEALDRVARKAEKQGVGEIWVEH